MCCPAASGYSWRTLVEADITRFKRVIGDGLRSRTDRRQATEVVIAVDALNGMLDLGRPEYVQAVSGRQSDGHPCGEIAGLCDVVYRRWTCLVP